MKLTNEENKQIDLMAKGLFSLRHHLHKNPELAMDEKNTSDLIAKKLEELGIKVHKKIGKTGLVGILKSGKSNKAIALRADMDALPIQEETNLEYQSINKGVMHACGHDGHMAMLFGAAQYLAKNKNFNGTVYFIFQPAEEAIGGAEAMMNDGLFEKFKIDSIYGLHASSALKAGYFSVHDGPVHASSSNFDIKIIGKDTHGAHPERGVDSILVASEIVISLQTIVSRRISTLNTAVVSVTKFNGGTAYNIIPEVVTLNGTVRTHKIEVRNKIQIEMEKIIKGICQSYGANYDFKFKHGDRAVINTKKESLLAISAAEKISGKENVLTEPRPIMGSEDFGFYLEKKPGCYAHLGNGLEKGVNHSSKFDFNDEILMTGVKYWIQLTKNLLE
ncbi:amidohydrolase [Candidatus Roizmanbacteria bacterium]|nr:amidohydrolase [Candidatus Roizmanbacteria bacterium]